MLLLEGPSGEDKSTAPGALCGLWAQLHGGAFSGRVTVAGHDTLTARPARIARMAGMVFQDPEGQAVLGSVARDVAFGLESAASRRTSRDACARPSPSRAPPTWTERSIATLSGGAPAGGRHSSAAVLAPAPAVLLMDEPTSQLDDAAAAALRAEALRALAGGGVAVAIAEHRPDRARALADRLLAVRAGAAWRPPPPTRSSSAPAPAPAGPVLAALEDVDAGHPGAPVLRDARAGTPRRPGDDPPRPQRQRQDDPPARARGPAPARTPAAWSSGSATSPGCPPSGGSPRSGWWARTPGGTC